MADSVLDRVREIAIALPEVSERLSHGAPSFFIREKKTLCNVHTDHHGDGRLALWAPAPVGVQAEITRLEPERFFVPPYVGHRGRIGVNLDSILTGKRSQASSKTPIVSWHPRR